MRPTLSSRSAGRAYLLVGWQHDDDDSTPADLTQELQPVVGRPARTAPRDDAGMVPARDGAVEPGPRLRARRGMGRLADSGVPAAARIALVVNLLTEDNLPYYSGDPGRPRHRRSVGRVDAPLDGRGGAPRDRDPRLPRGDPRGRSGRARARAHATGLDRRGSRSSTRSPTRSSTRRSRSSRPASRTATPASCSTIPPAARSWRASRPTRTCTTSSTATSRPRRSSATRPAMVLAMDRVVREFAMPGTGIPDFASRARIMAKAGVYDFAIHHDQILVPVVLHRCGLDRHHRAHLGGRAAPRPSRRVHRTARQGRATGRRSGASSGGAAA